MRMILYTSAPILPIDGPRTWPVVGRWHQVDAMWVGKSSAFSVHATDDSLSCPFAVRLEGRYAGGPKPLTEVIVKRVDGRLVGDTRGLILILPREVRAVVLDAPHKAAVQVLVELGAYAPVGPAA